MTIHKFDYTGSAYDATQCDESIKDGDILLIESEGVVGLAWTWPVAVTKEKGQLHSMAENGSVVRVAADAGWTVEQVKAAISLAREKGFEVHSTFDKWWV